MIYITYKFSRIDNFIPCYKVCNLSNMVNLFFKEVIYLHKFPKIIKYFRNPNFLCHLWRNLWGKLGAKIIFSITCHPQTDGKKKNTEIEFCLNY